MSFSYVVWQQPKVWIRMYILWWKICLFL